MASFKIAQNATFKAEVEIPRVGGDSIKVEFEFKYRDRKELSKYYEKWNAAHKAAAEEAGEKGLTWLEGTERHLELEVGQMKEIVVGWGFDEELTDESLMELASTCLGAPYAVIRAYEDAYAIARRGN